MAIRYCPYFCEENIWHLCSDDRSLGSIPMEERWVVFISNAQQQVAIRKQYAGRGGMVQWDYHVVLLAGGKVWDPDSTLELPVDFGRWVRESFSPLDPGPAPQFRVIDAPTYLARFASDRSHMLDPRGVPRKPLPPWPRIGQGMTLMRFADMETPYVGEILDLDSFRRRG